MMIINGNSSAPGRSPYRLFSGAIARLSSTIDGLDTRFAVNSSSPEQDEMAELAANQIAVRPIDFHEIESARAGDLQIRHDDDRRPDDLRSGHRQTSAGRPVQRDQQG